MSHHIAKQTHDLSKITANWIVIIFYYLVPLDISTSIVTLLWFSFEKKKKKKKSCLLLSVMGMEPHLLIWHLLWFMEDVALQTQKASDFSQMLTSLHTYSKYCTFTWDIQTAILSTQQMAFYTHFLFVSAFVFCFVFSFFTMKSLWYSQIFNFFYHICKAEISFRSH